MPRVTAVRASILVIGDEILGGFVHDTNSHWLAGRLRGLGVPLDRVHTVPDTAAAIDEALRTELARPRPRIVLTSGGIGSTPDDVTLASIAATLGLDLVVDPEIDRRITRALEWTASQGVEITPVHETSMRRMALVPEGSYLLAGARGVAPGVAVDVDGGLDARAGATIVVLPGIPGELRRIVEEGVEPELLAGRGEPDHVVELRHPYPESILTPVLEELVADHPGVHVGSYPGRECLVRLHGPQDRVEAAAAVVRAELERLADDPAADRLREAWQSRWQG